MALRPKVFTLEQANEILHEIKPLAENIVELAKKMSERLDMMRVLQFLGGEEEESPEHGELKDVQRELDELLEQIHKRERQIREIGCYPKDIHIGLVDFYSFRDGELIFLCWRAGEEKVEKWHALNKGCANRKSIIEDV